MRRRQIKSTVDAQDEMSISIEPSSVEVESPLLKLPDEIFLLITSYLTDRERKLFGKTCVRFYGFIQQYYTNSLYGRLFGFTKYLQAQSKLLERDIEYYHKNKRFSLTKLQQAILGLIALGVISDCFFFLSQLELSISQWIRLSGTVFSVIFMAISTYIFLRENINYQLRQYFIDNRAIDQLYFLTSKHPLLFSRCERLAKPINAVLRPSEVNDSLEQIVNGFNEFISELYEYNRSLIGKNVKSIDLSCFAKPFQFLLTDFLEKWNVNSGNKLIDYKPKLRF